MNTGGRPRVLIPITTRSYKASAFLEGARRLGIDVTIATERAQSLAPLNPRGTLTLAHGNIGDAVEAIRRFAGEYRLDAVLAADDEGCVLAATAAAALGFESHSPEGVAVALDKHLARATFLEAGLHERASRVVPTTASAHAVARETSYPCVLKPRRGSASRGVIRANDEREFALAFRRVARIIESAAGSRTGEIVIEPYLPGVEVAVEGLMTGGELRVLAIFDKPDLLEGPFFEETIYVTPSRLDAPTQQAISEVVARAATALGLRHGPVHAELRIEGGRVWPLEIAPRSIGGLCSRALRFERGTTLEEVILAHAVRRPEGDLVLEPAASGVMMIPVPRTGALRRVGGVEAAAGVPGVSSVAIAVAPGDTVVAWPEGNRYLGFLFAVAAGPAMVEKALREAHRQLEFDIVGGDAPAAALDLEDRE